MRRPIIFVLLAGFAALVAAMVVYSALKKREAEVQQAMVKSVDIVVAAHALGIGSKLDASSVKTVRWSRESLPPGAFTDTAAVMNKYTKTNFVENEPIVADWLFSGEKNAGVLPLLIPTGMRAVSVPVDEVSDIAGFVLPHAHVDVLVSVTSGDKPLSKIVLQNVEVLAIAQDIEQVNDKPQPVRVVTMLVTPDQAERLTLASQQGALRLALRNYDDKNVIATTGITVAQLLGAQPVAEPMAVQQHVVAMAPRPKPKPVSVEVMRNGATTESVSFVRSGSGSSASMQPVAPEKGQPATEDGSAKIDSSENFASGGPAFALGAESNANASESEHGSAGLATRGMGPVAAPEAALLKSEAMTGSASAAASAPGTGYNGPRAKTIDVP